MELVFATNNQNKIKEIEAILPKEIKILSLKDIGCLEDIPETSPTIEGNAIQKGGLKNIKKVKDHKLNS